MIASPLLTQLGNQTGIEQEAHRKSTLRGYSRTRSNIESSPTLGIVLKYSNKVILGFGLILGNAASRIRRCSSSTETPCSAARLLSRLTNLSSSLRTRSCAISDSIMLSLAITRQEEASLGCQNEAAEKKEDASRQPQTPGLFVPAQSRNRPEDDQHRAHTVQKDLHGVHGQRPNFSTLLATWFALACSWLSSSSVSFSSMIFSTPWRPSCTGTPTNCPLIPYSPEQ